MSKVVYLFGAGASIGAIPIVEEMKDRINEVINAISADENLLSKSEIFDAVSAAPAISLREHQIALVDGLKELKQICEEHFSVDTFAKKLSIKRDVQGLKKLKILLSVFFVVEQKLYQPNPRYEFFIASLIDSITKLPQNVRILSWNYDYQFEIAFSGFSGTDNIIENQQLLSVNKRNDQFVDYRKGEFGIFKLNGSTEFRGGLRNTLFFNNISVDGRLDLAQVTKLVQEYVAFSYSKEYKPIFTFAWETSYYGEFNNVVLEETSDAEVLVIIGYSFPYFNRSLDKLIIKNMTHLKKVYFQSPEANALIDRFQSIRDDIGSRDLIPILDLKYFYIPKEIEEDSQG
jgi:hypothetical protein